MSCDFMLKLAEPLAPCQPVSISLTFATAYLLHVCCLPKVYWICCMRVGILDNLHAMQKSFRR